MSETFSEMDKRLRAEMTPAQRANYARCQELIRQVRIVEATNAKTGRRSTFEFAEHYNIGPGWQMWDLEDGNRIVSSFDLADMEAAPPSTPGMMQRLQAARTPQ